MQAVERLECAEEGGRRQECEEVMAAVATAASSLKRRSVSMANRHRRRWREVGQGRESSTSSSSSRESLASGEGGREGGSSQGRGVVCEDVSVVRSVAGDVMMGNEEVLGLLERYSQKLVDLVQQQTLHQHQ